MTILHPTDKDHPVDSGFDPVYYPESDGKPMAESDLHRDFMFYLINLLQRFFAGQQVYVTGNLLVYYEKGNAQKSVAPDCFVVRGISPAPRMTYKIWEEGRAPEVVFEISSKKTHNTDLTKKMRLYAELGVREYFIYDPTSDYLDPALIAYELVEGHGYVPMTALNEEVRLGELAFLPIEGEVPAYQSTLLGLRITLDDTNRLCLFDLKTGEPLLSDAEARLRAERQAAEAERQAAVVEAENVRLRAEVEALRRQAASA